MGSFRDLSYLKSTTGIFDKTTTERVKRSPTKKELTVGGTVGWFVCVSAEEGVECGREPRETTK